MEGGGDARRGETGKKLSRLRDERGACGDTWMIDSRESRDIYRDRDKSSERGRWGESDGGLRFDGENVPPHTGSHRAAGGMGGDGGGGNDGVGVRRCGTHTPP